MSKQCMLCQLAGDQGKLRPLSRARIIHAASRTWHVARKPVTGIQSPSRPPLSRQVAVLFDLLFMA